MICRRGFCTNEAPEGFYMFDKETEQDILICEECYDLINGIKQLRRIKNER